MNAFVALLKVARLRRTISIERSCGSGRVLVPRSAATLKWCFEEDVSVLILLQKKLKENKRKRK